MNKTLEKIVIVFLIIILTGSLIYWIPKLQKNVEVHDVINDGEVIIPEKSENIYIAVPLEYMSMREKPGYNAKVLTQIYPGTRMVLLSSPVIVDDSEFYYMQTEDGKYSGYCSANYCIKVGFEYDENMLSIVDMSHADYSYDEMTKDLQELSLRYPDILSLEVLGQSVENRDIYCMILGNKNASHKIMVQAGIHGREYMTSQQVMKMLEYYAANYYKGYYENETYQRLFDQTAFYIIPMSNPDGVSISQMGENAVTSEVRKNIMKSAYERDKGNFVYIEDSYGYMMWYDTYKDEDYDRKKEESDRTISYEEYLSLWKANANGIDINRNFDAGWDTVPNEEQPGYDRYKGISSESEPETQILVNMVLNNNFDKVMSYHARGQLIYFDAEGNSPIISQLSSQFAQDVFQVNRYKPVNNKETPNTFLAGFGDWVMLRKNIPSVTIEMGKKPCPLSTEESDSIFIRNREVWAMIASKILSDLN